MYLTTTLVKIACVVGLASTVTAGPTPGSGLSLKHGVFNENLKKRAVFNASTATLDDFASHALEVAKSRIANSSTCTADKLTVRKLW